MRDYLLPLLALRPHRVLLPCSSSPPPPPTNPSNHRTRTRQSGPSISLSRALAIPPPTFSHIGIKVSPPVNVCVRAGPSHDLGPGRQISVPLLSSPVLLPFPFSFPLLISLFLACHCPVMLPQPPPNRAEVQTLLPRRLLRVKNHVRLHPPQVRRVVDAGVGCCGGRCLPRVRGRALRESAGFAVCEAVEAGGLCGALGVGSRRGTLCVGVEGEGGG